MLQHLENSQSMPSMSRTESLRTAAKFDHPAEIENYYRVYRLSKDPLGFTY